MALVDALLPEFDREMAVTRKLLERVPDGQFDWRPHDKSMTLGALAQHVARIPLWGYETLAKTELVLDNVERPAATSRADILDAFDRNVTDSRAALVGKTDAELMALWTLKSEGRTIFSMPRAAVWRSFMLSHLVHHRGQLTVYLRMQNVPLPSIYGPSADEKPL